MKPQAKHLDSCIAGRQVFLEILPFYNSFATLRSNDFATKHESIKKLHSFFHGMVSPDYSLVSASFINYFLS